ncbi:hypothetical protein [Lentzea sp. NPDC059081]|uniref:hypothetical protein n=1 Tax=Lentzea sp. NPDC059081 TaxID=3346719 RepID=UPI0036A674AB
MPRLTGDDGVELPAGRVPGLDVAISTPPARADSAMRSTPSTTSPAACTGRARIPMPE